MEKHPSSLAALAEIFETLAEIFPNGYCCFEILLAENRGNWKIFDKYFCFLIKNIISSARYYIRTEIYKENSELFPQFVTFLFMATPSAST